MLEKSSCPATTRLWSSTEPLCSQELSLEQEDVLSPLRCLLSFYSLPRERHGRIWQRESTWQLFSIPCSIPLWILQHWTIHTLLRSQESTWCEAMGFLLQYSSTLVIVHYLALASTKVLQVTLPVYKAVRERSNGFRKANLKWGKSFCSWSCFFVPSWTPGSHFFHSYHPMATMGHCAGSA